MSSSLYDDKLIEPDDERLSSNLADTKIFFDKICKFIETNYGDLKPEWKFYNKKSGWILKLISKKRNVLFIVPRQHYFRAAFSFSDRGVDLVFHSKLPEIIKKELVEARKYAEGRTIQIEIKNDVDCNNILELIHIKLST